MRSALLVVLLLATPFLAGLWGKVRCLGVGAILIGTGMLMYAVAPGYWWVALALALVGIGGGLKEALINPLIQELHPDNSGKYLNTLNGFWSVGVLLTMLLGGDLLTRGVSWRFLVGSLGLVSLASGALYLMNRRGGKTHVVRPVGVVLRDKVAILRSGRFWLFWLMMFFAGGIEGAYTFWSASYFQLELGTLPRASGIGTACFWPSIQSYSVDRLPFDPTALFILLSCGDIPGFAFVSWLVGWIGDSHGLRAAFLVLPGFFFLLIACFLFERGLTSIRALARKGHRPS